MFKKLYFPKVLLLVGDIVIITISFFLAFYCRFGRFENIFQSNRLLSLIFIVGIVISSFYIFDQYNVRKRFISLEQATLFLVSLLTIGLLMSIGFYFVPFIVGRGIFFFTLILLAILSFIWRAFFPLLFGIIIHPRKVLLVGEGKEIDLLAGNPREFSEYNINIIGWVNNLKTKNTKKYSLKFLGDIGEIENIIKEYEIDDVVIINESIMPLISWKLINLRMSGLKVHSFPNFFESITRKLPINYIEDQWVIYSQGFDNIGNRIYRRIKRGSDIGLSLLFLIGSIPLTLIIGLLIKLTSKGPVFYTQERLGQNKNPFRIIKFRTMVIDAEKEKPQWAEENDTRVTKIGKILRKTRLDELPQLVNILKGEMSFIGPRPEREYFIKELEKKIPYFSLRFAVKPGLTGWAQVNYRYGASLEDALEKFSYDLYYIKNMSLFLDLRIILRTIRICLFGMGR
ncbi:MAG: sugar transferase [Candidatus Aminicenantes bacterium]|nr:sugar transferase [Candidatus Aminicenantes bacterium]